MAIVFNTRLAVPKIMANHPDVAFKTIPTFLFVSKN